MPHNPLTADQNKLTDLVRRLEKDGYEFGVDIAKLETDIKNASAETVEKIYLRAEALDDGSLSDALGRAKTRLIMIPSVLFATYFILALLVATAVLLSGVINFYYLVVLLIVINGVLLVRSFFAYRHSEGELPFDSLYERFTPQTALDKHAYTICLEERNLTHHWQALKLIQHKWLALLVGVMIALMVSYALRVEAFVWQAGAYQGHIKILADSLNFVPQLFGSQLDNVIASPDKLLYFFVISILIYALLPRAVAWTICQWQTKAAFKIDGSLYYYDNLYRKFSPKISDDADYVPYNAKPKQASLDPATQQIVATVNRPAIDDTWYRFGAGFKVYDFGVVDDDTLEQFLAIIEIKNKPVYLGVFADSFPDEQTQKLILTIKYYAVSLSVEIIKVVEDDRLTYFDKDWQQFLLEMHIDEVRY